MKRVKEMTSHPTHGTDYALLGSRIRHIRQSRSMTLSTLAHQVHRAPSLLSQIENGKRGVTPSLLRSIAQALSVPVDELLRQQAPSERAALELELKSMQESPLATQFSIPDVHVGPRLPTDALRALVEAYRRLDNESTILARTPESARIANLTIKEKLQEKNNYLPHIEKVATDISHIIGHEDGPMPQSGLRDIANYLGYHIVRLPDIPAATRSITDKRTRRIYVSTSARTERDPRLIILRALGDIALAHEYPRTVYDFLRQRVEANYFAAAILMPEKPTAALLHTAMKERELALSDLSDISNVGYETAVHRFTNLATQHLDLNVHFLRVGQEGIIYKAYANDGIEFNHDSNGFIEGQFVCREFGALRAFDAPDYHGPYYQYTDTPSGTYWSVSRIETYSRGDYSISLGVPFDQAMFFRGRDTTLRFSSHCPDTRCCRVPNDGLAHKWADYAWASPKIHSHTIVAEPAGKIAALNDREIYEFLEKHAEHDYPA